MNDNSIRLGMECNIVSGIYFNVESFDNPFDTEDLTSLVANLDIELFKNEYAIFLLKASKKLLEKNKRLPTIQEVESYLDLTSSKWLQYAYKCEVEVFTYAPATLTNMNSYIKILEQYKKKDTISQLGI